MNRRSLLWTALSMVGAGLLASRANAATADEKPPAKLKVVYHLADADRVHFALGNIQNHFDGVGGPDNVTIALVVLGPKRLPEAGRGLGSAIRGFKDSLSASERREDEPAIQPSRDPDHAPGA